MISPAYSRRCPLLHTRLLRLAVVLLAVDAPALVVLRALDAVLLARAHVPIGAGAPFHARVARLAALELRGLAGGQAPRLQALLDALLLVDVALHVRLHALRRGGVRIAGLRVVLLAVDVAADLVLLTREARLLRGREPAVLHGARLVAFDPRFLTLEAGGLLGVELAGLQTLLDSLLLVDVALHRAGLRERARGKCQAEGRGEDRGLHCSFPFV